MPWPKPYSKSEKASMSKKMPMSEKTPKSPGKKKRGFAALPGARRP